MKKKLNLKNIYWSSPNEKLLYSADDRQLLGHKFLVDVPMDLGGCHVLWFADMNPGAFVRKKLILEDTCYSHFIFHL